MTEESGEETVQEDPGSETPPVCENGCEKEAVWYCSRCRKYFCILCVIPDFDKGPDYGKCPVCKRECKNTKLPRRRYSFYELLESAFVYPFRGMGAFITPFACLFSGIAAISAVVPVFGWIFSFIVEAFLLSYCSVIIRSSAWGDDDPPDWGEVDSWYTWIRPLFSLILISVVSLLPLIILGVAEIRVQEYIFVILGFFSLIYFLISITGAVLGVYVYLNPLEVAKAALKTWKHLFWLLFILGVMTVSLTWLGWVMFDFLEFGGVFFLGMGVGYCMIVFSRILGSYYLVNETRLGWIRLPEELE